MIRWGIAGTGGIANAFADALRDVSDAELAAVGSRDPLKAAEFAVVHSHLGDSLPGSSTYEGLVNYPDVDVVYIATPASCHYEHTMMALSAGKHVLCEKPFAMHAQQALKMLNDAENRGLFLMEAMWPRFLPSYMHLRQALAAGAIGTVLAVEASFGGRAVVNPNARPFRPELGGGALLDAAVYPIQFAQMICGLPSDVRAVGTIGETGVDEQVAVTMRFPSGAIATGLAALTTTFTATATVYGTDGMIVLPGNFTNPSGFDVLRPDQPPEHHDHLPERHRLAWQVDEVHRCLADQRIASTVMSWADTYDVMVTLDRAREQVYP